MALGCAVMALPALGAPFADASTTWLGATPTVGWSNKVELCDIDGDSDLDAFVANGSAYNEPDLPERPFFWRNAGDRFVDDSAALPVAAGWWRVVKCADVDGDGDSDLFFGGTFQSQSALVINEGNTLVDASDRLPQAPRSFGDAEFADVDGDLDLDLILADWGAGDPFVVRGRPRIWIQDRAGFYVDDTDARFPPTTTGFSWDLEAVDVDDDLDLDVLVSCKICRNGGLLLKNDLMQGGRGVFSDDSAALPGTGNNYEFEPFDFDGDSDLDLFTVNDGINDSERVLRNDGGVFTEMSNAFAATVNTGDDDNAALVLDYDGDGDEDVLIASLSGDDRILENAGGRFVARVIATDGARTTGSLAVATGDLDGDGRLDLVMGQGETDFSDRVFLGRDVAVDTEAPLVGPLRFDRLRRRLVIRAHDHITPVRDADVVVTATVTSPSGDRQLALIRAGELLWAADVDIDDRAARVCARDRRGLEACSASLSIVEGEGEGEGEAQGEGEGEGEPIGEGEGEPSGEGEGEPGGEGEGESHIGVGEGEGEGEGQPSGEGEGEGPGAAPGCCSSSPAAVAPGALAVLLLLISGIRPQRRRV